MSEEKNTTKMKMKNNFLSKYSANALELKRRRDSSFSKNIKINININVNNNSNSNDVNITSFERNNSNNLLASETESIQECEAMCTVVLPRWEAQPWWPTLMQLAAEIVDLPTRADLFLPGRSGHVEPWANSSWTFIAARVLPRP